MNLKNTDHWIAIGILVLFLAFPAALYRDLILVHNGERIDLTEYNFSETKTYDLEVTWQKGFWQGSVVELWVDDCLRSLVVNGCDISEEYSYCDFLGSHRIDLAPYLTDDRAILEVQIENLGGPGGLTISGLGNVFVTTYRYWLIFLLILIWLYRRGRAEGEVRRVELKGDEQNDEAGPEPPSSLFSRQLATVPRVYRGVLIALLTIFSGIQFIRLREASSDRSEGSYLSGAGSEMLEPGTQPERPGRREAQQVTIPAFKTGAGAPSWEKDERLNPRILIDGGEYLMGSPDGVRYNDEQPQRRARVSHFWMQGHEVTHEEYRRFKPGHGFTLGHERYPVVNVTWHQALAYAEWLGGSLPSEAQWELAARGAQGRKYPWGDEPPTCARANFNDCGWRLKAVGGRPDGATPKGIEDLAGNVWEWCGDWYADRRPPDDQTDPRGPDSGFVRVIRGGSLISGPGHLWGTYRGYYHPGFRSYDIGFRVVWDSAGRLD